MCHSIVPNVLKGHGPYGPAPHQKKSVFVTESDSWFYRRTTNRRLPNKTTIDIRLLIYYIQRLEDRSYRIFRVEKILPIDFRSRLWFYTFFLVSKTVLLLSFENSLLIDCPLLGQVNLKVPIKNTRRTFLSRATNYSGNELFIRTMRLVNDDPSPRLI